MAVKKAPRAEFKVSFVLPEGVKPKAAKEYIAAAVQGSRAPFDLDTDTVKVSQIYAKPKAAE